MRDEQVPAGGRLQMPRSRGAASGFLLILLGAWGALIPFIGPYFDFAFTPDTEWTWTMARGWLEVLRDFDRLVTHGTTLARARAVTTTVLTGALWLSG